MSRTALQIFRVPIVLGVLSAIGLLSALLGDSIWDAVSWAALGVPCLVIAWCWFGSGRRAQRNR
jgi:hypothetical protein